MFFGYEVNITDVFITQRETDDFLFARAEFKVVRLAGVYAVGIKADFADVHERAVVAHPHSKAF